MKNHTNEIVTRAVESSRHQWPGSVDWVAGDVSVSIGAWVEVISCLSPSLDAILRRKHLIPRRLRSGSTGIWRPASQAWVRAHELLVRCWRLSMERKCCCMTSFEKPSTITVCLGYARCAYYDALLPPRARRMVIMICKRTLAISRSTPCLTQRCTRRQSVRGSPRSNAGCVCRKPALSSHRSAFRVKVGSTKLALCTSLL